MNIPIALAGAALLLSGVMVPREGVVQVRWKYTGDAPVEKMPVFRAWMGLSRAR